MTDDAIWAIARSVPGWETGGLEMEPLEGGITNRNFVVTREGERFVLRVPGRDTELLGIDRANEARAATLAAEANVGPPVVAFLPASGCFVARFVEGSHIPIEDLRRDDVLGSVVRSLRRFHRCTPVPSAFNVFQVVQTYAETAAKRGVATPSAYLDARELSGRIDVAFRTNPSPLTTCHNDLLNANFLRDGDHTWIVDYEYAGMGDPFFDLGNLSINNGLDDDAQALLLRTYFGEVRDVHRARLALMRIVSDLREAMWGVVQQAISTLDFDYVDYATRHFRRLLASADDARVDGWLEAAREPLPATT